MAQAVPVALGAIQTIDSIAKEKKLAKQAAELAKNRPIKTTSQFDNDALRLSESELANGMSAGAEQAYNDSNDRSISSSISALLKGGGSVNNVGDIYSASEEGRQKLAILEDQLRMGKINDVLKQYEKQSSEQEKNWMVNEYGPYKDQLQAIGEQRKAAAQAKVAGINTMGSGLMNGLGEAGFGNMFGKAAEAGGVPLTNSVQPAEAIRMGGRMAPSTLMPNNAPSVNTDNIIDWKSMWDSYKIKI